MSNETTKTRRNGRPRDQWVLPFLSQYKGALALALILGILTYVFSVGIMFNAGYLISAAAEIPISIMAIFTPLLLVQIFGICKPISQYLERLTSHNWVLHMTSSLRVKLYSSIESDAMNFKRTHRTGDVLGLLADDIGHLQNLYLRTVFPLVIGWILALVVVIALGFFSLLFALLMLVVLLVIVALMPLVALLTTRARTERRKAIKDELYSELTDNVLGATDWVFAGRGDEYLNHTHDVEQTLHDLDAKLNRSARRRDLIMIALLDIVAIMLIVWSAMQFGGVHGASSDWIAAFVLGFFPLLEVFAPMPAAAAEGNVYQDSVDRLNELPPVPNNASINLNDARIEDEAVREGLPPVDTPPVIQIDNVHFSYVDLVHAEQTSRPVLDGIRLTIQPGEHIAILGRSGSGKSTLVSLMRGDQVPTEGRITIGGVDASAFGDDMAHYVGVIQQQTYLFNRTLIDNLRIGREDVTEEEVLDVLDKVGLSSLVERLPEGLNTMVDEAGMRFSGGERHRIALARVLLQNVPIIVLDEPTVGLDPATERALLETLFETTKDRTLVMVTHHLQGVARMDRVVFIEGGHIELEGSPDELARTSDRYRKLLEFDRGIAQ